MPGPILVYNSKQSTAEDQLSLHALLPAQHDYGDTRSVLVDGTVLAGREAHDAYCSPELRLRARKRCYVMPLNATHTGSGQLRRPLAAPLAVVTCLTAVPDWHAAELDVERRWLFGPGNTEASSGEASMVWPTVGPATFRFDRFIESAYEDIVMSLSAIYATVQSMRITSQNDGLKAHVKLVPLGVGPSIRSRYGDYIGHYAIPAYMLALQMACNAMINDSWACAVEFVDHTHGQMSPYLALRKVRVISGSARDAFDFEGSVGVPCLVAPCDAFARPDKCPRGLVATLSKNSNLADIMSDGPPVLVAWPPRS